jgi:signal transduction histidine kinase
MTVRDNGLGIDLKKHGHNIFGLHKTFHPNPEAKGIGLFLTKTQVENMGGTIVVESEVGRGTVFTITF